ncbi:MAG TPA: hypothetical protein VK914_13325 [bacterium]|jgi:hypothetical protein|nr:hypothetical protein [bacterium]
MSYPLFARARKTTPFALLSLFLALAGSLSACACGCQIFDLGLSDMPTTYNPDRLTLQYSFMDQNENQSGSGPASPALNPDKENESSFYTVSLAHQFNNSWGLSLALPYLDRRFTTDVNGSPDLPDPSPSVQSQTLGTLGDVRVMGMYTGFSEDMAIGLEFGVKLPTGPFTGPDWLMDRDTAPGTGTTDLLIGAFDRGQFSADWGWYGQTLLDAPLYAREGYEPANNLDIAAGLHFDGMKRRTRLTPLLQANVTIRGHDSGGGDSVTGNYNSGYENLYLSPGLQADLTPNIQATGFVYLPVSRNVNGEQLVASWLVNAELSYLF